MRSKAKLKIEDICPRKVRVGKTETIKVDDLQPTEDMMKFPEHFTGTSIRYGLEKSMSILGGHTFFYSFLSNRMSKCIPIIRNEKTVSMMTPKQIARWIFDHGGPKILWESPLEVIEEETRICNQMWRTPDFYNPIIKECIASKKRQEEKRKRRWEGAYKRNQITLPMKKEEIRRKINTLIDNALCS